MTARAEARSAARADAFQPGHLTWRALASRRHCLHSGQFIHTMMLIIWSWLYTVYWSLAPAAQSGNVACK